MKVVVAVDSFKGSLDAKTVCAAVREGVMRVDPHAELIEIPLADGGEGTAEQLVHATGGTMQMATVTGPLGIPVQAMYGVLGDEKTAVIEMAQASGLTLVPEELRNPLLTTSRGTGELIAHALDSGYRRFVIGLGGSATNDGGAGMLQALGMRFFDERGEALEAGGGALGRLARFTEDELDHRLAKASFVVASDVQNRLVGPEGASVIFGPQKGATPEMTALLDAALDRFGEVVFSQKGLEMRQLPGGGAAGGMGAALAVFLGATLRSGIEVMTGAVELERRLQGADLVITGEGRLDEQTLSGKVIAGVSRAAARQGVPVFALCGELALSAAQLERLGVVAAFSIVPGPCTLAEAMGRTAEWTADAAERLLRVWKIAQAK
ncbi:glycerate kinase [Tumebacillus algifaecis]|uniref:Glycerate kinase n=1 Tax=Tumebacillus algifaecis TaxID=1214604 RepID=A0A223CXV3_9BACL|nr:glycerate kinase [Tumebacillus algifaecis]ASS74158.1 glycerate kinase [Tumebacillus algifaecis]